MIVYLVFEVLPITYRQKRMRMNVVRFRNSRRPSQAFSDNSARRMEFEIRGLSL